MSASSGSLSIISDAKGRVMEISDVIICGKKIRMPAFFLDEDQALDLLFQIEQDNPHLAGTHNVIPISSSIAATLPEA